MKEKLEDLLRRAVAELAGLASEEELQELRVRYLGKKGELTAIMKGIGALSPEERPAVGQIVNLVRDELEEKLEQALSAARAAQKEARLKAERLDVTLPGRRNPLGSKHPVTLVIDEVSEIFARG